LILSTTIQKSKFKEITIMANKYFVWKDANCNGVNPEWIEMDGRTFYAFTKDPANKDRRFVRLGNEVCEEADIIYLEATYEQ
jgi:hypothetical protein